MHLHFKQINQTIKWDPLKDCGKVVSNEIF